MIHGTLSSYVRGCRCPSCKREQSRRLRIGTLEAYNAGLSRTPPLFHLDPTVPYDADDPRHGKLGSYTRGCRCFWCKEAARAYREHKSLGMKLPKDYNARNTPRI